MLLLYVKERRLLDSLADSITAVRQRERSREESMSVTMGARSDLRLVFPLQGR